MDIISDPVGAPSNPEVNVKPDVVFLLDESGSMTSHRSAVVSTFNEYVASVRGTAKTISLYTFDSSGIREKLFKQDPNRVAKLTEKDYRPNASTPLYDAFGAVVNKFRYGNRPVQMFVHTDGQENASKEWTKAALDELIAEQQNQHNWLFTYLMEGIQARETFKDFAGLKMGFTAHNRVGAMNAAVQSTALYASTADSNPLTYTVGGTDEIDIDKGEELKTTKEGTA